MKKSITRLFLFVGAMSLILMACGRGPSVDGDWVGQYHYPKEERKPVQFSLTLRQTGMGFVGRSTEPNTFGDKTSSMLFANIEGEMKPDGHVSFKKQMDGTAGAKHFILYEGQMSKDKKTVSGTWSIPESWSGSFEMSRR